ncbi:MAG: histidine kinase, partial [Caldimonas sp.]
MLDVAILGQVALGYSPFIDRNRAVTATRLSVYPLRPDATLDVAQLLHAVGDVWPASGGNVSLNVVSESLLHDLLQASPSANLMVEVPNFMAADPDNVDAIVRLHGNGNTLLLKGRPNAPLPREVLPCFKYSIIDLADDRRITESTAPTSAPPPAGVTRTIAHVQSGV